MLRVNSMKMSFPVSAVLITNPYVLGFYALAARAIEFQDVVGRGRLGLERCPLREQGGEEAEGGQHLPCADG